MQFRLRTVAVVCTAIFFLFVAAVQTARAQDITGRISGTVTDTTGAVVVGASVTITNEATGVSLPPFTTNSSGFFVADDLPVGSYTVTAAAKGFKTTSLTGNYVVAGGRLTADVTMELGTVTETVTVMAVTNSTNTTSGELQTTLTQAQMINIPLNQGHYEEAVTLIPGAYVTSTGQAAASILSGYSNGVAFINGQRGDGQFWAIDGGYNEDAGSQSSNFNQVSVAFIQELDVQTSNYDAEYGRSASATINVITRSGGDQYHGGAFEFVQNNDWNAITSGTKLTNAACRSEAVRVTPYTCIPPFHYNDYGWDFGGPVPYIQPKGKLFIFAGQEWRKIRGSATGLQSSTATETFPTAAELTGNFTDVLGHVTLILPAGAPAGCTITANVLSPACITVDGQAIANVYAAAATIGVGQGSGAGLLPTSATGGNETFNLPNPGNFREDIIRADEHANDHQSLYFRYLHDYVDVVNPYSTFGSNPEVPVDPDSRHRPGTNLQFGWTDIISPSLINEFKINADWHSQTTPLVSPAISGLSGPSYLASTYGFAFLPPLGQPPLFPGGLPNISFNASGGAAAVNGGLTVIAGPGPNYLASPTSDINPIDNVTWVKNNHTIKFGIEFARNRKEQNARPNYNGAINFNSTSPNSSGDDVADALMGTFNTVGQTSSGPVGQFRFNVEDAYVEDTWKFNRKLSIVMGVRFSHTTPSYAQGNNMTQFNPLVGTQSGYLPSLGATFFTAGAGGFGSSTIVPFTPGTSTGQLILVPGQPLISVYTNGLERPGGVPSDQAGRVPVTQFDPLLLAAIPGTAQRGFYAPENLWAPRFGFSYAPFGDKTVVRGGFGIFYDHPEGNALCGGINCQGYQPWAQSTTVTATSAGANLNTYDAPAPQTCTETLVAGKQLISGPCPSAENLNTINPNLVVARSYQYSLSVQRQLPEDMLLQVAYVGTLGRHVLRGPTITDPTWSTQQILTPNAPNPNTYSCAGVTNPAAYHCMIPTGGTTTFANGQNVGWPNGSAATGVLLQGPQLSPYLGYSTGDGMAASDVNSNYNSAQVQLTKRTGFVTASIAYTYSKYMGMAGGAGDAYNQNAEPECPYTCLVSTAYDTTATTAVQGALPFQTVQTGPFVGGSNPVTVTSSPGFNGVCTGGTVGYVPAPGGCQSGGVLVPWNKYYYGETSVNATHIISMSFTVDSPWGKGTTGLRAAVERGWSVTGIVHYQTGSPATVTDGVAIGNSTTNPSRRAAYVNNGPLYNSCAITTQVCWVNPANFFPETALAAGDAPISDIKGPAFYQWDMSVQKTFILPWREGMNLQLRADAINAFNQTNLNVNNGYKSLTPLNGSFGQINATQPSRIVQIGGKFNF